MTQPEDYDLVILATAWDPHSLRGRLPRKASGSA
jgi:hypothetical protein